MGKVWAPSKCASCINFIGLAYGGTDKEAFRTWVSFSSYYKQTESKKVSFLAIFLSLILSFTLR